MVIGPQREREKKEICWVAWGLLFIGLFNFLAQWTKSNVLQLWCILLLPLLSSSLFPLSVAGEAKSRSQSQRWTSGLFTGRISGSEHQIRGFLGHIRRADTLPARALHKGEGPDGITQGKDVSWEFRGNECPCVWVCWLKCSAAFKSTKNEESLDIVSVNPPPASNPKRCA